MKTTWIDGKPETQWAMEQVTRIFGFATLPQVKAALRYDEDGMAILSKNGLRIVGTRNRNHWAPVKITWRGVGTLKREAALEYSERYLTERSL